MQTPHDGIPEFEQRLLPRLRAIPFFRLATEEEIDRSFAAYAAADFPLLIATWLAVAEPTRATLDGIPARIYRSPRLLPVAIRRVSFLSTLRAVLAAGRILFDEQLRPESARAIRGAFSWIERRHEHIPPGFAPAFRFPDAFVEFIDGGTVEEAKVRFQIVAALNEVQQHAYSLHFAEHFDLPEVAVHAEREREMALDYLGHFAPPSTRELWRQSIIVLDGLNAAVFAMALRTHRVSFPAANLWHAIFRGDEWRQFRHGLGL
ncbi:MAG: hypothetical protein EXR72_18040 [Myxococcales bacterium]|nr:hypothetical protein [Myxococcales bacterium]